MAKKLVKDKQSQKPKKRLWTFGLAIPLLVIAILVVASYLDLVIPFVPKSINRAVDIAIGSVPVVPKTNRQLIYASLFKNTQISSYEQSLHLEIKDSAQKVSLVSFDSVGSFEMGDSYSGGFQAWLGPQKEIKTLKAETREVGKDFYFKIDSLLFPGMDLHRLYGKWYQIDIDNLEENLKAQAKTDQELRKDIRNFFTINHDEAQLKRLARRAKRTTTKVNGKSSYQLSFDLTGKEVQKLIKKDLKIKQVKADLFLDRDSGHLVKVAFEAKLNKDSFGDSWLASIFLPNNIDPTLNFSISINKINQDQKIEPPPDKIKQVGLFELYEDIQGSSISDPAVLIKASQEGGELGSNLLTLQRLTHVLFLLPTAF